MTHADYVDHLGRLDAALRRVEASAGNLGGYPASASQPSILRPDELPQLKRLRLRLADAGVLLGLARSEHDAEALAEVGSEIAIMTRTVTVWGLRDLLSGVDDQRDSLVTIRAGAGGVDAEDFTYMLFRMYLCWAELHGFEVAVYRMEHGEDSGMRSAIFMVQAPYAFGMMSAESGVHQLVRVSSLDHEGHSQTSFAVVEVIAAAVQTDGIEIPDEDLRVDFFGTRGPSCNGPVPGLDGVRVTHLPTGVVVAADHDPAQAKNRAAAITILKAKLLACSRATEPTGADPVERDQVRSYVLQPHPMVRDLRTGVASGNPTGVFDGDIDAFIEAGVRRRRAGR